MPNWWVSILLLIPYFLYRLFDILSYELGIVFIDRHSEWCKINGHLLSADRRVLLLFIRLLDFMGCYAILYLAIGNIQGNTAFIDGSIDTSISAIYLSVIIGSFTGLSKVTPGTDLARLAILSEIITELILFTIILATFVGSIGNLTEIRPRPRRDRIFLDKE